MYRINVSIVNFWNNFETWAIIIVIVQERNVKFLDECYMKIINFYSIFSLYILLLNKWVYKMYIHF